MRSFPDEVSLWSDTLRQNASYSVFHLLVGTFAYCFLAYSLVRLLCIGLFVLPYARCSLVCVVMYQPVRVDIRLRLRFDVLLIITCVLHFKGWGEGTWY